MVESAARSLSAHDIAIRARDLTKIYRLYAKPVYRFLDMFGLLQSGPGYYTEHAALDGVSLDIHKGEKVAIIGRNGAGKSTFLKLVTGVIEATSGSLSVRGKAHALLQIGTGFHPDFTGRENVYAYLAQLGVSGREADRMCAEIVEFAEIETYVDQPVKTYSTGMSVRLMFATSTAVTPDLLVLDEVLGVGDAYFAHKSFERMREMCERDGTTLLLVTHDIYSAAKLCTRVIWIDRGHVVIDGEAPTVIKAYEHSVRQQEEERLRVKKQQRLEALAKAAADESDFALLEIASRRATAHPAAIHFSNIVLQQDGREIASLPLDETADSERLGAHLQTEGSAWGPPQIADGRVSRALLPYGSSFHKVAALLPVPRAASLESLTCAFDYQAPGGCDLVVRLRLGGRTALLGEISATATEWTRWTGQARGDVPAPALSFNTAGMHGTGAIVIRGARFVGHDGNEALILPHGARAQLDIDYEVRDPSLRERPQVVVAIHKDGVHDVARFISRDLLIDASLGTSGTIRMSLERLSLTDGRYSITIMIAREGYYDEDQTVFYTINPGVYACVSRLFEVQVTGAGLIGSGTLHVLPACWSLQ